MVEENEQRPFCATQVNWSYLLRWVILCSCRVTIIEPSDHTGVEQVWMWGSLKLNVKLVQDLHRGTNMCGFRVLLLCCSYVGLHCVVY